MNDGALSSTATVRGPFVPENTAHDGTFRKLEVRVRRGGLRVRARKGYYAEE